MMSSSSSSYAAEEKDKKLRTLQLYSKIEMYINIGIKHKDNNELSLAIANFRHALIIYITHTIELTESQHNYFKNMQDLLAELTETNPHMEIIFRLRGSFLEEISKVTPETLTKDVDTTLYPLINQNIKPLVLASLLNFYLLKHDYFLSIKTNIAYTALNTAFQIMCCLIDSLPQYRDEELSGIVTALVNFFRRYTAPNAEQQFALFRPVLNALDRIKKHPLMPYTLQDSENWQSLYGYLIILGCRDFFNKPHFEGINGLKKMLAFFKRTIVEQEKFDQTWQGYIALCTEFITLALKSYTSHSWPAIFMAHLKFYELTQKYLEKLSSITMVTHEVSELFLKLSEQLIERLKSENSKIISKLINGDYLIKFAEIESLFTQTQNSYESNKKPLIISIGNFRRSYFIDTSHIYNIHTLLNDKSLVSPSLPHTGKIKAELQETLLTFINELGKNVPLLRKYAFALQRIINILKKYPEKSKTLEVFNRQFVNTCGNIISPFDVSIESQPLIKQAVAILQAIPTSAHTCYDTLFLASFNQHLNQIPVPVLASPIVPAITIADRKDEILPEILLTEPTLNESKHIPRTLSESFALSVMISAPGNEEIKQQDDVEEALDWLASPGFNDDCQVDMFRPHMFTPPPVLSSPPPLSYIMSASSHAGTQSLDFTSYYYNSTYPLFSSPTDRMFTDEKDEKNEVLRFER
jgi:hypothetical protein